MYSARDGNSIAVRLEIGEDVVPSLLAVCTQYSLSAGFVQSGIGMFSDPELGFFAGAGHYEKRVFPGCHELLNLSGNVSLRDGAPMLHLHCMLADEQYQVFDGHLFGARVGMTLEVLLTAVPAAHMHRELEPSGLPGLFIEQQ